MPLDTRSHRTVRAFARFYRDHLGGSPIPIRPLVEVQFGAV